MQGSVWVGLRNVVRKGKVSKMGGWWWRDIKSEWGANVYLDIWRYKSKHRGGRVWQKGEVVEWKLSADTFSGTVFSSMVLLWKVQVSMSEDVSGDLTQIQDIHSASDLLVVASKDHLFFQSSLWNGKGLMLLFLWKSYWSTAKAGVDLRLLREVTCRNGTGICCNCKLIKIVNCKLSREDMRSF